MEKQKLRGNLMGIIAYTMWGFLPLYWKQIEKVPALEILGHRIVWSLGFLLIILLVRKDWRWLIELKKHPRWLLLYLVSAILVSANWFTYIWAVTNAHTVDASLGYFINPLFSVFLGMVFFGEKLSKGEIISVLLAASGVIYLTIYYRSLPWVAVVLTLTFGFYGFIKKRGPLDGIESLALETLIIFLPTLFLLFYFSGQGITSFGVINLKTDLFLILAGVVTATPLLLFGQAARLIPMSTLGFLQYLAPTFQFIVGVVLFKEQFQFPRLVGFSIIWLALLIFSVNRFCKKRSG